MSGLRLWGTGCGPRGDDCRGLSHGLRTADRWSRGGASVVRGAHGGGGGGAALHPDGLDAVELADLLPAERTAVVRVHQEATLQERNETLTSVNHSTTTCDIRVVLSSRPRAFDPLSDLFAPLGTTRQFSAVPLSTRVRHHQTNHTMSILRPLEQPLLNKLPRRGGKLTLMQ